MEEAVHNEQDAPESGYVFAIVGRVLGIAIESDRIGNLDRHVPDLHVDAERGQRCHELFVEIRD